MFKRFFYLLTVLMAVALVNNATLAHNSITNKGSSFAVCTILPSDETNFVATLSFVTNLGDFSSPQSYPATLSSSTANPLPDLGAKWRISSTNVNAGTMHQKSSTPPWKAMPLKYPLQGLTTATMSNPSPAEVSKSDQWRQSSSFSVNGTAINETTNALMGRTLNAVSSDDVTFSMNFAQMQDTLEAKMQSSSLINNTRGHM